MVHFHIEVYCFFVVHVAVHWEAAGYISWILDWGVEEEVVMEAHCLFSKAQRPNTVVGCL